MAAETFVYHSKFGSCASEPTVAPQIKTTPCHFLHRKCLQFSSYFFLSFSFVLSLGLQFHQFFISKLHVCIFESSQFASCGGLNILVSYRRKWSKCPWAIFLLHYHLSPSLYLCLHKELIMTSWLRKRKLGPCLRKVLYIKQATPQSGQLQLHNPFPGHPWRTRKHL